MTTIVYIYIFIVGLLIGSFLNVCIYRIPRKEDIVFTGSHCTSCGYRLRPWDLIPVFSWIFLKGRCRSCKEKISVIYPAVELVNAVLWLVTFIVVLKQFEATEIFEQILGNEVLLLHSTLQILGTATIYSLTISALIVLSFIDFNIYEIPGGINVFILVLGVIMLVVDGQNRMEHMIGFFAISLLLVLLLILSKGRAIGGGDVKLMAVVGLVIGWKLVILSFFLGCLYGSVIHILRMKFQDENSVLAMGPYFSIGILTAMWFGNSMIDWYMLSYIF